jgi:hypothetical protein
MNKKTKAKQITDKLQMFVDVMKQVDYLITQGEYNVSLNLIDKSIKELKQVTQVDMADYFEDAPHSASKQIHELFGYLEDAMKNLLSAKRWIIKEQKKLKVKENVQQ